MASKGCIGRRVAVNDYGEGVLSFYGKALFAAGDWCGITLDRAAGENNGTVNGKKYFHCKENHGVFAPAKAVKVLPDEKRATGLRIRSENASSRRDGPAGPATAAVVKSNATDDDAGSTSNEKLRKSKVCDGETPIPVSEVGKGTSAQVKVYEEKIEDCKNQAATMLAKCKTDHEADVVRLKAEYMEQIDNLEDAAVQNREKLLQVEAKLNAQGDEFAKSKLLYDKRVTDLVDALSQARDGNSESAAALQYQIEEERSKCARLQKEVSDLVFAATKATAQHSDAIDRLGSALDTAEMSLLEKSAECTEWDKVKLSHLSEIAQLRSDAEGAIAALHAEHINQLTIDKQTWQKSVDVAEAHSKRIKNELVAIISQTESHKAATAKEIDHLKAEVTSGRLERRKDATAWSKQRDELDRQRINSEIKAAALASEVEELLTRVNSSSESAALVTYENTTLNSQVSNVKTALEEAQRKHIIEIQDISLFKAKLESRIETLEVEAEGYRKDISIRDDAILDAAKKLKNLEEETSIIHAERQSVALKEERATSAAQRATLEAQHAKDLKEQLVKIESLKAQLEATEAAAALDSSRFTSEISRLVADAGRRQAAMDALDTTVISAGKAAEIAAEELDRRNTECVSLNNRCQELESYLQGRDSRLQTLQKAKQAQEAATKAAEMERDQISVELSNLREELTSKNAAYIKLQNSLESSEKELGQLQQEIQQRAASEMSSAAAHNAVQSSALDSVRDELESTLGELLDSNKRVEELSSELRRCQTELARSLSYAKATAVEVESSNIRRLRESLSMKEESISMLQGMVNSLEASLAKTQESTSDKDLEVNFQEVQEVREQLDKRNTEYAFLERRCFRAETDLKQVLQDKSDNGQNDKAGALRRLLADKVSDCDTLQARIKELELDVEKRDLAISEEKGNNKTSGYDWKSLAGAAKAELESISHVLAIKTDEAREARVKCTGLEEKLKIVRVDAQSTVTELVKYRTTAEELEATLEIKRVSHERVVIDNAHLREDLKSLEDDMRQISIENGELRRRLANYRQDLEMQGTQDPFEGGSFHSPSGFSSPSRPRTPTGNPGRRTSVADVFG